MYIPVAVGELALLSKGPSLSKTFSATDQARHKSTVDVDEIEMWIYITIVMRVFAVIYNGVLLKISFCGPHGFPVEVYNSSSKLVFLLNSFILRVFRCD